MENFTRHKEHFVDGFTDGYYRAKDGKDCRWQEHKDIKDGFICPNPVYSLAYETGFNLQKHNIKLSDELIDDCFIKMIKHFYARHHQEFND